MSSFLFYLSNYQSIVKTFAWIIDVSKQTCFNIALNNKCNFNAIVCKKLLTVEKIL